MTIREVIEIETVLRKDREKKLKAYKYFNKIHSDDENKSDGIKELGRKVFSEYSNAADLYRSFINTNVLGN